MTQYNRNTLIMSITILLITSIGAYKAFIYGFERGAVKYAPIVQTQATDYTNTAQWQLPLQASVKNNLQQTVNPQKQL